MTGEGSLAHGWGSQYSSTIYRAIPTALTQNAQKPQKAAEKHPTGTLGGTRPFFMERPREADARRGSSHQKTQTSVAILPGCFLRSSADSARSASAVGQNAMWLANQAAMRTPVGRHLRRRGERMGRLNGFRATAPTPAASTSQSVRSEASARPVVLDAFEPTTLTPLKKFGIARTTWRPGAPRGA